MSENWFLAVGGYSLCIWIKNSVICDVKCILSKNHSSLIFRTQPSKLYIWFLILFFSIEKILHGEFCKVNSSTLCSKRAVISIDFLFWCSSFLGVLQHVLCQSTNLNYIIKKTELKKKSESDIGDQQIWIIY